jgi:glycosyltransferase involved in cell wall biosynthesis
VPAQKISVVENGVETDDFSPHAVVTESLRSEYGLQDKFVASYIGTMGNAHGLETLLNAATTLQIRNPQVMFLLVGEGAEKAAIKAAAQSRGLENAKFIDQQPRERIPSFILASDTCLVLLKKTRVFETVIPTKMLEFMSCGRPVILGVAGQARQILEAAGVGLAIEPESSEALADAIQHLYENPRLASSMGQQGREYIVKNFSRASTAEKYIKALDSLMRRE